MAPLLNSLVLALGTTLLSAVIGCAAAMICCRRPRFLLPVAALAVLAFCYPPFLLTNTWLFIFGTAPAIVKYSVGGAVLILASSLWPICFALTIIGLRNLDWTAVEVLPELRGWQLVRWFLFPQLRTPLLLAGAICFSLAAANLTVPATLQVPTVLVQSWMAFNTTFNYSEGLTRMLPLLIISSFVALLASKLHIAAPQKLLPLRMPKAASVTDFAFWIWILVTIAFPLIQMAAQFAERPPRQAFSAAQTSILQTFLFAISLGLVAASCSIFTGAYLRAVLWFAFLIPGIFLGIGAAWGRTVLAVPPLLALLACALKFLIIPNELLRAGRSKIPQQLKDIALTQTNRTWRILFRPYYAPSLFAGFFIVYLLALWEVETLLFVVPPGFETLSLRAFNFLHYGYTSDVYAFCAIILVLGLLPLIGTAACRRFFLFTPALLLIGCSNSENSFQSSYFSRVEVIGHRGSGAGELAKPRSLAVDSNDNLYVSDMSGRVQKFDPSGKFLLQWQLPQTDLGKPKGMGIDSSGNIIVIEPHYARINHFDTSGQLIDQWGGLANNLVFPRSIISGKDGCWVSEYGQVERLQFFNHDHKPLLVLSNSFNRVEGLALDKQQRLYVADSCNHAVKIFSAKGEFLAKFGTAGSAPGELSYPYDVRVDSEGRIYVCEYGNSRIQIFSPSFTSLKIIGGPGAVPGKMSNPWAITFDSEGNLYVADGGNHRVQKFVRRAGVEGRDS